VQWVQLDLEKIYPLYAIALWHDHRWLQVFHGVVAMWGGQSAEDKVVNVNPKGIP